MSILLEVVEEGIISNFAVLLANGWIPCCGESNPAEWVVEDVDEDAIVVRDDAELKPGDNDILAVDIFVLTISRDSNEDQTEEWGGFCFRKQKLEKFSR